MSTPNGFGLAGIIGMPVAHSRSPTLHNFWLNAHGISGAYLPLAVEPARLKDALPGLVALGFRGCNVTMPHKQTAMPLLHRVNETAKRIGAVNTIVVEADGTLSGFNNDGNGFVQRLRGCVTVNGLGLLLNQARLAFKAWFGILPDVTPELLKAVHATF